MDRAFWANRDIWIAIRAALSGVWIGGIIAASAMHPGLTWFNGPQSTFSAGPAAIVCLLGLLVICVLTFSIPRLISSR